MENIQNKKLEAEQVKTANQNKGVTKRDLANGIIYNVYNIHKLNDVTIYNIYKSLMKCKKERLDELSFYVKDANTIEVRDERAIFVIRLVTYIDLYF